MSFNWIIYKELNPDLIAAGLTTQQQLERHYISHGKQENRITNVYQLYPNFNVKEYRNRYNDLAKLSDSELEIHWIVHGRNEGRTYKSTNCIVTCYYDIKSKFVKDKYLEWINNFMNVVEIDIILFTSENMRDYFLKFNKPNLKIVVKPLEQLYFYRFYDTFVKQWVLDPIKDRRSPELYILWYNKIRFIEDAHNIDNSYDNYIWCDIGVFRENNRFDMRRQFGKRMAYSNSVVMLNVRDEDNLDKTLNSDGTYSYYIHDKNPLIGGGIFLMPKNRLFEYLNAHNNTFNKFIHSNRFFGCDQIILPTLYYSNPGLISLLRPPINYSNDIWFYLLDVF